MHHCIKTTYIKKEVINIFSTFLCPLRQSGNYFFLAQFPFVSSDLFSQKILHNGMNVAYCSEACLKSR